MNLPRAVIFDWDGTLVDSEPLWVEAERAIAARHGVTLTTEQCASLCGLATENANTELIAMIGQPLDWREVAEEKRAYVVRIESERPLMWRPGAEDLMEDLYEAGVPCGVYSARVGDVLSPAVARLKPGRVRVSVDADQVTHGKPDPEGFILAAHLLGFDPADCLVVEDSVAGMTAGRASGAVVLGVPSLVPLGTWPGQVNVPSLEGVTTSALQDIFAQARAQE